ncbi:acyl-CoA dehydrogenase family protein [Neptuniibacter caesariensis]|uniref:3-methylmercaptopropionyl-CoA dehydrogenase n=1 Tax=Neptuniibacter caesariensis TaxID=207954 RepID=A0A7U8GTZ8_NEPCE|nr:acyl-CoA dehydrogenase family protein [Neptuniibacter caesariensis]EAR62650.1 Acyl-CoA dehydrogenase, C-terminal:Acyl-CoA dehydrogenase, central region [Oceanospirillum sp. MED92] [Neptuniibacter caesariensis]
MADYKAPQKDMNFALSHNARMAELAQLPGFEEATDDMVAAILEEAGKVANEVLSPLNEVGDHTGVKLEGVDVPTPAGFADAYQQFAEGGWGSLQFDPEFGGQGLPYALSIPVMEMWQSANMAWGLCPLLSQGAVEAIFHNGSDELKAKYLPQLVSGEWTGTMNLTEPQAGSDLAAIRSTAKPVGDHYRIKGQKIFITWGEHDMAENIIHLVLARLPDAPPGVKGISLFVVPKFLVNDDGSLGERNDAKCVSLEHKLGIHASPTCVMAFGDDEGAIGYLVGEENRGLACMFTMMNNARLAVGLQGVAISERAYQHALEYAHDRVQSPPVGSREAAPIIQHADVRRMLLTMKTMTEAGRALAYDACASLDFAHHSEDPAIRAKESARAAYLTPIVKGWCTEFAQEVTSLGVQVHGGMGFIEETGAAQHYRDARILPIYEGTNAIQALDLVGRKTLFDGGEAGAAVQAEIAELIEQLQAQGSFAAEATQLQAALELAKTAQAELLNGAKDDVQLAGSVAFNYLMLMGTLCGGWQLLRAALAATAELSEGGDETFLSAKVNSARFYSAQILPRSASYAQMVAAGSESVMTMSDDELASAWYS